MELIFLLRISCELFGATVGVTYFVLFGAVTGVFFLFSLRTFVR